jgi:hypothetical protein
MTEQLSSIQWTGDCCPMKETMEKQDITSLFKEA